MTVDADKELGSEGLVLTQSSRGTLSFGDGGLLSRLGQISHELGSVWRGIHGRKTCCCIYGGQPQTPEPRKLDFTVGFLRLRYGPPYPRFSQARFIQYIEAF